MNEYKYYFENNTLKKEKQIRKNIEELRKHNFYVRYYELKNFTSCFIFEVNGFTYAFYNVFDMFTATTFLLMGAETRDMFGEI